MYENSVANDSHAIVMPHNCSIVVFCVSNRKKDRASGTCEWHYRVVVGGKMSSARSVFKTDVAFDLGTGAHTVVVQVK